MRNKQYEQDNLKYLPPRCFLIIKRKPIMATECPTDSTPSMGSKGSSPGIKGASPDVLIRAQWPS